MKFCGYCGKQLDDNAGVCFACGKEVLPDLTDATDTLRAEEAACLDKCYRMFKFERLMWKIFGIFLIVAIALMALLVVMLLGLRSVVGELPPDVAMEIFEDVPPEFHAMILAIAAVMYAVIGLLVYLPIAIVNFKMVKRAEYYMDTVYTDPAGAVKRAGSAGMIVLGVLFNTIAMIFIIINFAQVKNNKAVLDRIIARQQVDHGSETV